MATIPQTFEKEQLPRSGFVQCFLSDIESKVALQRTIHQTRRIVCGNATCRCHKDSQNRHGPYHYWTRKSAGKTVGMMLTEDELPVYREWIKNQRNLERILREMRKVSTRVLAIRTGRKAP